MTNLESRQKTSSGFFVTKEVPIDPENPLPTPTSEAPDILRQLVTGVVTVGGDGSLAFANPAAEQLLGFQGEQYLGLPFLDFLEDVSEELAKGIVMAQRDRRHRMRLSGSVVSDGRTFPIGVTTTLHEAEGEEPGSVTAIFTDISDQVRLQELNRRTERLEAVAELSASLAHEIKNPLTPIRLAIQELDRSYRGDDQAFARRLRDARSIIEEEVAALRRLTSEFSAFAKLPEASLARADLNDFLRDAVRSLSASLTLTEDAPPVAELALELDSEALPVSIDAMMLKRCLDNLVRNAAQALEGRPPPRQVLIRTARRGTRALLEVHDSGPGVAERDRGRIFDAYFTTKGEGTGLGLPIVKKVVLEHGGEIRCEESRLGGAVFSIELPMAQ